MKIIFSLVFLYSFLTPLYGQNSGSHSILIPFMDRAREGAKVTAVHEGVELPNAYKGRGVLIGIIDQGFDYTHPNFKDEQGKCRILNVWEQGSAPSPQDGTLSYGKILDDAETIVAKHTDNNMQTHGTHVAGIAAGSSDNAYQGIAPESKLVLVSTNNSEQGIVDGVRYLINYARSKQMPIAINISIGSMRGYKDGSGLMARKLDSLLVAQRGCLLSIAVGNEGNRNSTLKGVHVKSYLETSKQGTDNIFVEGYGNDDATVTLILKNWRTGEVLLSEVFDMKQLGARSIKHFGSVDKNEAFIKVLCAQNAINGKFSTELNIRYRKTEDEVWILKLDSRKRPLLAYSDYGWFSSQAEEGFQDGTNEHTIAMTATGKIPIAVGAWVTRDTWKSIYGHSIQKDWGGQGVIYPLSAKGPTADGRIKPDLVAPGAAIVSSFNSFCNLQISGINPAKDCIYKEVHNGRTYYWGIESGTSMAAPIVTGTLALMLEACPSLSNDEARAILCTTAEPINFFPIYPNNSCGAGKLNVMAAMKMLNEKSGVGNVQSEDNDFILNFSSDSQLLSVPQAKLIQVFSIQGQLLMYTHSSQISMKDKMGCFIVVVKKGERYFRKKIVIG